MNPEYVAPKIADTLKCALVMSRVATAILNATRTRVDWIALGDHIERDVNKNPDSTVEEIANHVLRQLKQDDAGTVHHR